MASVAKRITGFTDKEFLNATLPTVSSAKDVFYPHGVSVRQSVRIFARKIVGTEDLNEKRKELRSNIPSALKLK